MLVTRLSQKSSAGSRSDAVARQQGRIQGDRAVRHEDVRLFAAAEDEPLQVSGVEIT